MHTACILIPNKGLTSEDHLFNELEEEQWGEWLASDILSQFDMAAMEQLTKLTPKATPLYAMQTCDRVIAMYKAEDRYIPDSVMEMVCWTVELARA